MPGTTIGMRVTAVAIIVVVPLDLLLRLTVSPGWIFAFLFVLGAPVWLVVVAVLGWIGYGLLAPASVFGTATGPARPALLCLLWAYLITLTYFCLFMSDGGDADDWHSPASRALGVDGYNSATPEYLNRAQELAIPSLLASFVILVGAAATYGWVTIRQRRARRDSAPL